MPVLPRKILHELQLLVLRTLLRVLPSSPVPVMLAGTGSALQLCRAIADTGVSAVLVVTDRVLVQLGIVAPLVAELESRGVSCRVYDGIEPDPTHAQIEAGIAIVKEARSQAVLAIGGGSPMDAAKIIAACATNGTRVADIVGNFKIRLHPLPIYAIPTTAGTGAEVAVAAVVTDTAARAKTPVVDGKLVPAMAALDGSLMTGLPRGVTAASGMDALTHAVESFLSRFADERTRPLSIAAVRIVFRHLQRACDAGGDLEARQAMSLGASYAGLAFSRASVGYVHAIAHTLGGLYHTPHGLANA
ncbi:MAG: iron-containing alcohol dehydrogenase, partial [Gammaproteobacteria bacterium]